MNQGAHIPRGPLKGAAGSILIHVAIMIVLVRSVFFKMAENEPAIEIIMTDVEPADLEERKMELKRLDEFEPIDMIPPLEISLDEEFPTDEIDEFDTLEVEMDVKGLEVIEAVQGPLILKGMYQGRSKAGRKNALAKHAGSWARQTEASVVRALEWLKHNQNNDGS